MNMRRSYYERRMTNENVRIDYRKGTMTNENARGFLQREGGLTGAQQFTASKTRHELASVSLALVHIQSYCGSTAPVSLFNGVLNEYLISRQGSLELLLITYFFYCRH